MAAPAPEGAPRVEGNRVEIQRSAGVEEWFVNGPVGVEQGFTLAEALLKGEAGDLVLELRVAGDLTPSIVDGAVALRSSDRRTALWYTGLFAEDADGRELASWMDVEGQTIRIHVEEGSAAYPIRIDPVVTETAELVPTDAAPGKKFGTAVAIDGDTAVVSARESVYVFARVGGVWSQQAKLTSGVPDDYFGHAVAIKGNTILVGAFGGTTGAVYVFGRSGTLWTQESMLQTTSGTAVSYFGVSVALSPDGTTAVIGAVTLNPGSPYYGPGAAYVFVRSGGVWAEQAKLTATPPRTQDGFGADVAIDGDTVIVGQVDLDTTHDVNAVNVFVRSGSTWTLQTKLSSNLNTGHNDSFGSSVSLSGDALAVGAPDDNYDSFNTYSSGAVYIFQRSGGVWTQQSKLQGKIQAGHFSKVALAGELLIVGEYVGTSNFSNVPLASAYVYLRSGAAWTLQSTLRSTGIWQQDMFGWAVSLSGGTAIIGAFNTHYTTEYGAAFTYKVPASNGSSCAAASDCIGQSCVDGVCCDTACGGGVLDCQACNLPGSKGTCTIASAGTACRPVAGGCDVAESCDGASPSCPQDAFVAAATPCRPSAGQCDVAEACSGGVAACPGDTFLSNGTSCDDSNPCTLSDACQNGACKSGLPVVCVAPDQCHDAGTCDPATGQCAAPPKVDGSGCNDGNPCTLVDVCQVGVCVAGPPLVCLPLDACHQAGTCDPATGVCSNPASPDTTVCDDGSACTAVDRCQAGVCVGGDLVVCAPLDECHVAGSCAKETGQCSNPAKANGTPCSEGACQGGTCVSETSSSTGSGDTGAASTATSSSGTSGSGGSGETSSSGGLGGASSTGASGGASSSGSGDASSAGGCGCRMSEAPEEGGWILCLGALLASARRRERRAAPRRSARSGERG